MMNRKGTELLACPGCGFKTIDSDTYGSYDICPICGWEDDNVQLANPCSPGGANGQSLHEIQLEVIKGFHLMVKEKGDFVRDEEWRPLSQNEIVRYEAEKEKQRWMNYGETDPKNVYWKQQN